jgi:hypothetical protein
MKVAAPEGTSRASSSAQQPARRAFERHAERTFLDVLGEARPKAVPAGPPPTPRAPSPSAAAGPLARAVQGLAERVGAGEARVDALLDAAARGKTFTAAELIAMQATVFRYSQAVEVLSRGADRLVGALKQTLGTQV